MTDLTGAKWHKSSRSGGNGGNCVEVADDLDHIVAVRDSKDRDGGVLVFGRAHWTAFLAGVRDGEFDQ
jgi:Domain of unknown function (DUF397)